MKTLILAGGKGFLGSRFALYAAQRGYKCIILTRNPERENEALWDGVDLGEWCGFLEGAEGVINFTGRSVNCLHNRKNRREILESRTRSVAVLNRAIEASTTPPKVFVQSGSLAIYGDTTESCGEDAPHGEGFTVDVCEAWEKEFFEEARHALRKCYLRIGFVLGPNEGAMVPLRNLTKSFLGGTVLPGTQYMSWIHENDMNRLFLACVEDLSMNGVYNATSPNPISNREFMRIMRKVLGRPWSPPAPPFVVKMGATLVMRIEPSLALTGRRGIPERLLDQGFQFQFSDAQEAIRDVLSRWGDGK